MIALARVLVRILGVLLLALLAAVGIVAAVFCIQGDSQTLSLPHLADVVQLGVFRDTVGRWFGSLEASGPIASVAALCGVGAVLLGLLLLAGVLVPRRERLVTLDSASDDGALAARRRALAQVAGALAEQARGVTGASVKARPRRRRAGGTLRVTAEHTRAVEPGAVEAAVKERLEPLTGPFELSTRVRPKLGESGSRVQ